MVNFNVSHFSPRRRNTTHHSFSGTDQTLPHHHLFHLKRSNIRAKKRYSTSTPSPVIVNIFMEAFEEEAIAINDIKPIFCYLETRSD